MSASMKPPTARPGKDARRRRRPFAAFAAELVRHDGRRAAIDALYRAPETEVVPALVAAAELPRRDRRARRARWRGGWSRPYASGRRPGWCRG